MEMRYVIKVILLLVALCGHGKALEVQSEVESEAPIVASGRQQRQLVPQVGPGQPVNPPSAAQQGLMPVIGTLIGNLPALQLLQAFPGLQGLQGLQGSNWMALPTQLIQGLGNLGGGLPLNLGAGLGNLGGSATPTCPSSQRLACRCESVPTGRPPAARRSNIEILQYSERSNEEKDNENS